MNNGIKREFEGFNLNSPIFTGLMEPDSQSETSDRFYLLKKDSQRRAFVVRVLKADKVLIIDSWHRNIAKPESLTKVSKIFKKHT